MKISEPPTWWIVVIRSHEDSHKIHLISLSNITIAISEILNEVWTFPDIYRQSQCDHYIKQVFWFSFDFRGTFSEYNRLTSHNLSGTPYLYISSRTDYLCVQVRAYLKIWRLFGLPTLYNYPFYEIVLLKPQDNFEMHQNKY